VNNPTEPTPDQLRAADSPETVEQLRQQALELRLALESYHKLNSLCKRFINKHHIHSKDDLPGVQNLKWLLEDICECIGYDP